MAEFEKQKVMLYDFLYIDRERIKSFYAQLFGGLQIAVQQVESSSATDTDELKVGPSFGSLGSQSGKTLTESRMENLDPHDLILRDVLQGLAENEMIAKDPDLAEPGSLVLMSGTITIFDMKSVGLYFDIYKDLIDAGKTPTPEWLGKTKGEKNRLFGMMKKLLEVMPLGLQVIVNSPTKSIWGTLTPDCLRESAGDILLKHGHTLSGTWHMLAIVDISDKPNPTPKFGISELIGGLIQAGSKMIELMGRPTESLGVTPLLIFRKLP